MSVDLKAALELADMLEGCWRLQGCEHESGADTIRALVDEVAKLQLQNASMRGDLSCARDALGVDDEPFIDAAILRIKDRVGRLTESIQQRLEILHSVTACEPLWDDDYGSRWCAMCSGAEEGGAVQHEESCPWQMAVDWCASR